MSTDLSGPTGDTSDADEYVEIDERGLGPWKVLGLVVAIAVVAVLATVVVQQRLDDKAHDSVDVGFMQDMISHHGQAVQLGSIGAQTATDSDVENFALDSVISQQYEVGYMTSLLEDWGYGTGDEDRDAMAWMGAPTSVEDMPGMLTPEQIETFRTSTGDEANAQFLQLMSEHHRGGLHMAQYAAEHAEDPRVKALAQRIVSNQKAELAEYQMIAERLGITL